MERIKELRKPPASLVKLIESIGILLLVPITKKKTSYLISLPSNYDDTITALLNNYDECIVRINQLESSLVENDTASMLYNKILDPSFIYEDVINAGGLIARDLFNCCLNALQKLQKDTNRIPLLIHNMLVLVDGSRAGLVALDTAAHVCRHGTLHIVADSMLGDPASEAYVPVQENMHLLKLDIHRRCKSHYKLPDHCFEIHDRLTDITRSAASPTTEKYSEFPSPNSRSNGSNLLGAGKSIWNSQVLNQQLIAIKQSLSELSEIYDCQTLILGLQNPYDFQLSTTDSLPYWAVWDYPGDTIITKGISYHRPFTEVSIPRTMMLYLDPNYVKHSAELARQIFLKALRYCRTGDNIIVLSGFLNSEPIGDNRELRYDFGQRHLWLKSEEYLKTEPNRPDWNETMIDEYRQMMQECISKSFLQGKLRIERYETPSSRSAPSQPNVIQMLASVALQENVQGIILPKEGHEEIIGQCIRDHPHTLVLLK